MMNALVQLRPWFLARQRREKMLAAVFLIAVAIVWLVLYVGRAREFSLQLRVVRADANEQEMYLGRSADDDVRYQNAINALSPESFPKLSEVMAQVDALWRKYGFKATVAPSKAQPHDRILIQQITVGIDSADYEKLRDFQRELAATLPTVHLKQFTIRPAGRNSQQLNARLELEAIEFNR